MQLLDIQDKKKINEKLKKIESSIVKVEIENKIGYGFFYIVKDTDFSEIPVLITSSNTIDLDHLVKGTIIKISDNKSKKKQEIEIKDNTRRFTNKCFDITMIEVEKNDLFNFVNIDDEEIKDGKNIYIIDYQGDAGIPLSDEIIKSIENSKIKNTSSTEPASPENSILNNENYQILNTYKSNNINNMNTKTLIKYANDRFLKVIKKEIIYDFMNVKDKYPNSIFYKKIEIDGDEYEGELTEDNIREGYGWCKSADNYIYKGEYKNNKRNGYGILLRIDGEKEIKEYEGYWKDDQMHGKGEQNLHFGCFFIGEWDNGKRQKGEIITNSKGGFKKENKINYKCIIIIKIILGVIIFIIIIRYTDTRAFYKANTLDNGDKYEGKMSNGNFERHGLYTWNDGSKYNGKWKNGIRDGYGVLTYSNGDKYEGEWKNNKKEGYGTYIWAYGDKYRGNWKNDKKKGYGVFIYSNDDSYEGEWENDEKEGKGKYTYSSGGIYEGEWKNDKKEGHGVFTSSDGTKYEGKWKNGEKVRPPPPPQEDPPDKGGCTIF